MANMTITQQRIIDAKNTEPIRNLTDNDLSDLVKHLALVVGISEVNKTEIMVLANFISNNYPTFGRGEILLAFDFAFAGKFNIPDVRVKSISPRFIGIILTAYENFKRVEMKGIITDFTALPQMTETELARKNREAIRFFFERHKENRANKNNPNYKEKFYPGSVCYDWLTENGVKLRQPEEVIAHNITDHRRALEIQMDALTVSKSEIVAEYFDTLIKL